MSPRIEPSGPKYATIGALRAAFAGDGELSAATPVVLDYEGGYIICGGIYLFQMNSGAMLEQCLTLLGIPWESV